MKASFLTLILSLSIGTLAMAQGSEQTPNTSRKVKVEQLTQTYNAIKSMSEAEFKSLFGVLVAQEETAGRYEQALALKKTQAKITKNDFLKQIESYIQDSSTNGIFDFTFYCSGFSGIGASIRCFFGIIFTVLTLDAGEAHANF